MKQVGAALRYISMHSTSLNQPLSSERAKYRGEENESTLGSVLPSHIPTPDKVFEAKEQLDAFKAVIKMAEDWVEAQPLRTQEIVSLRLGLFDKHALVLDEIGHKLGLTRQRVHQIEVKAIPELEVAIGFSRDEIHYIIRSVERLEVYILSAM